MAEPFTALVSSLENVNITCSKTYRFKNNCRKKKSGMQQWNHFFGQQKIKPCCVYEDNVGENDDFSIIISVF